MRLKQRHDFLAFSSLIEGDHAHFLKSQKEKLSFHYLCGNNLFNKRNNYSFLELSHYSVYIDIHMYLVCFDIGGIFMVRRMSRNVFVAYEI